MEIGFYSNKRKIEKKNWGRYDSNLRPLGYKHGALASTAMGNLQIWVSIWSTSVTFNVLKVSQSRAIIDRFCQDEGFELTYYIETLILVISLYVSLSLKNQ